MPTGTLFSNNRTQVVRLPAETHFPITVKHVSVRVVGQERILAPVDATWDSFFAAEALQAPADFLIERAEQFETPREGLVLVTNNTREFERVPGLLLENWVVTPAS